MKEVSILIEFVYFVGLCQSTCFISVTENIQSSTLHIFP